MEHKLRKNVQMAGGRHYYDLAAFTLYIRDKNSDLTAMASISQNFLIYTAVFLGVVTVILNSHLKGNDCGSFLHFELL